MQVLIDYLLNFRQIKLKGIIVANNLQNVIVYLALHCILERMRPPGNRKVQATYRQVNAAGIGTLILR